MCEACDRKKQILKTMGIVPKGSGEHVDVQFGIIDNDKLPEHLRAEIKSLTFNGGGKPSDELTAAIRELTGQHDGEIHIGGMQDIKNLDRNDAAALEQAAIATLLTSPNAPVRGRVRVFDWDKAAKLIAESGKPLALAQLAQQPFSTGGIIMENGKTATREQSTCYLASDWDIPQLGIGTREEGEWVDCWCWKDEKPEWDFNTIWPQSALDILWMTQALRN